MKLCLGALSAMLFAFACVSSSEDATLAIDEAEAIGVCGANADPVTGVMCHYDYYYDLSNIPWPTYLSHETFEQNGLDYVRCRWRITCNRTVTPKSDGGTTCLSVIGTGCNEGAMAGPTITTEKLLPAGTTEAQLATFCDQQVLPTQAARGAACNTLDYVTEQYEDRCCVPRPTPVPNPPPTPE